MSRSTPAPSAPPHPRPAARGSSPLPRLTRLVRLASRLATCAALFALAQAAAPVEAAPPPPINLELAIDDTVILHADGDISLFGVNEAAQDEDLNGDGDLYDTVIQGYDGATGQVIAPNRQQPMYRGNTGTMCIESGIVAFTAYEDNNADFNGDGDETDYGLGLWDLATGDVDFGPKAASAGVACGGGRIGYRVSESNEQADHNGDGDQDDNVWHVYRLSDGNNHNLEIASIAAIRGTARMNGRAFVFEGYEPSNGKDYNKDTDEADRVIMMYRYSNGRTYNSGLAGTLQVDQRFNLPKAYGRFVPFRAEEWAQDDDLNGDGDQDDTVGFAFDTRLGTVKQGLAGDMIRSASRWLTLVVDEAAEDGTDFNGDGDATDHILAFQNAFTGARWFTDHALQDGSYSVPYWETDWSTGFHGRRVTATVFEAYSDLDLNGDGDELDRVIVTYDPASNSDSVTDGLSTTSCYEPERVLPVNADYALGCRWEPMGPSTDFNGDGDTNDSIAQIVDLATGAVTSTDLAIDLSDPMRLGERTAFVIVDEASHGSGSLNGDGDTNDDILHWVDLAGGNVHNTGMDVHTRAFFTAPYTLWAQNSGNLVFAVSEAAHGSRDLNGDGDAYDLVVHIQDF